MVKKRKKWLSEKYSKDLIPEYHKDPKDEIADRYITYEEFINKDFIEFAHEDNVRVMPSIDGLKPSHRKIIISAMKKGKKFEEKVSQFANKVAGEYAYKHGEKSLCDVVHKLGRNYIGSNNVALLTIRGNNGNRINPLPAAPRYTFVKKPKYFTFIV